jgi:hypothetical protein
MLVLALTVLALTSVASAADPPERINYQGVLRSSAAEALDGSFPMTFRFFDSLTGGDEILVDTHGEVTVSNGLFNVEIGGGSVTDGSGPGTFTTLADVFANYPNLHLEVEVSGETLSPRIRVVSAGYALNARYVRGLEIVSEGPLDLHVDGVGGDDGNDGLTPTTAKETIQAAIDAIPAVLTGEVTVRVKPGTYNERVRILERGRVNDLHWIRLTADPVNDPPTVFIDGTGVPVRSDGVATAGVFVSHALVEVEGIHVTNFRDPDNDRGTVARPTTISDCSFSRDKPTCETLTSTRTTRPACFSPFTASSKSAKAPRFPTTNWAVGSRTGASWRSMKPRQVPPTRASSPTIISLQRRIAPSPNWTAASSRTAVAFQGAPASAIRRFRDLAVVHRWLAHSLTSRTAWVRKEPRDWAVTISSARIRTRVLRKGNR